MPPRKTAVRRRKPAKRKPKKIVKRKPKKAVKRRRKGGGTGPAKKPKKKWSTGKKIGVGLGIGAATLAALGLAKVGKDTYKIVKAMEGKRPSTSFFPKR